MFMRLALDPLDHVKLAALAWITTNRRRLMSIALRIETLRSRHSLVDRELLNENQRPWPSTTAIRRLKREKLRIKDEIERLATN